MGIRAKTIETLRAHPDWSLKMVASEVNMSADYVGNIARREGLPYAKQKTAFVKRAQCTISLAPEELEIFRQRANAAAMTVSAYVRSRALRGASAE